MPESAVTIQPLQGASPRKGAPREPHRDQAFALLVDAVLDYAIYLLDPDGRVLSWNLGAQRMKGYTPDEIVGRHFSTFYTPEDVARGRPQEVLAAAAADGRYEDEGWRVRKDGTRFWADVVVTALRRPGGELYGFAKVTRDLTERRAAIERDKQLAVEQQARVAAEEALRARDWFLSIASHELRTPIASLQVATESLLHAYRNERLDGRRLVTTLERIERASSRLGRLAGELLDVSRMQKGQLPLRSEPVDVERLVHDVAGALAEHDGKSRVEVAVEPGLQIEGDAARLDQVVTNLVDNALKYSSGKVMVRVAREGGGICLTVTDSGIGLDEGGRVRLFEPFARGGDVTHIPGMGLGLYISRHIVERHGGRISAHSDGLRRGTTFTVWLPASPGRGDAVA